MNEFLAGALASAVVRPGGFRHALAMMGLVAIGVAGPWVAWLVAVLVASWKPHLGRRFRWLLPDLVRVNVDYVGGAAEAATERLRRFRTREVDEAMYALVLASFIPTAAGRYREALRARPLVRPRGGVRARREGALIAVNRAEALYNQGRPDRAERLLCALASSGRLSEKDPLVLCGAACQLAWVCALRGDGESALWLVSGFQPSMLPVLYRAEFYFTLSFAHLARGDATAALRALEESRVWIRRVSSARNELFLRARALAAIGRFDEAEKACEVAAEAAYRGQGGDGLLLWSDLLSRRGALARSHEVLELVLERDPESGAARVARARLATRAAVA